MSYIKVMIVDDEVLAIEDLRNMISWEEHGFQVVATASNGRKALEAYEIHRPEVIFVDISMPVMDGLEFSSKIAEHNNGTKIILLTSYKDFEYAKQAVKIGVSNYLLKHETNESTLLEELKRVKDKLLEEKQMQSLKKREVIRRVLEGKELTLEAQEYWNENIQASNRNILLILVKKDERYPLLQEGMEEKEIHSEVYEEVLNLEKHPYGVYMRYIDSIEMKPDLYTLLLSIERTNSQQEIRDMLYNTMVKIQEGYKEKTGETISAAASSMWVEVGEISKAYKKVLNAIEYSIFKGREKIIWTEEVFTARGSESISFDKELQQLSDGVNELNFAEVQERICSLFGKVTDPYLNLEGFKKLAKDLISGIENFRIHNNMERISDIVRREKNCLSQWYCVSDMKNWFLEEYKKAMEEVEQSSIRSYSKKIQMVIQYIHDHYAEDLIVEEVAEVFDMSGVYLSQLFKKETGQTFLKYLTNRRIHVAKKLLESNKYTVNEVAARVGYNTSQYFSKIFHEATGFTPKAFMKTGGKA